MKYLYLKLGRSNAQLKYCLQIDGIKNVYGIPIAYIFFGNITSKEYKELFVLPKDELKVRRKKEERKVHSYRDLHNQIEPFFEAGENRDVKFISIFENKVYIFEPDSEVLDMPREDINSFHADLKKYKLADDKYLKELKNSIPKMMYVKNIKMHYENIPYILRTLNASQYYNRGTCREIKEDTNWGIIQAIKKVLNEPMDIPGTISPKDLFKLLSPHQFETLIFLMLTNANIYSPAWRAGSLPDIDIVGINYSDSETIRLGKNPSIVFEKDKEVTFQIKQKKIKELKIADWGITLDSLKEGVLNKRLLESKWLLDVIKNQPNTMHWLEHSLKWYFGDINFKSILEL